MTTNRKRVWAVVMDAGRVQCLDVAGPGKLEPVPGGTFDNETLGRHARDLRSDKPGRTFASTGGGMRHSLEPNQDYRKLEKHHFTASVAEFLDDACAEDRYDRCILVAPPRSLGELRDLLSNQVKKRVFKEIPKDLAGRSAAEIASALSDELEHVTTSL